MTFFRFKTKLYPLIAITASLFVIVFGLVVARNKNLCWYLLGVLAWLCIFGCFKGVLKMLPAFVVFGGAFAGIAYAASAGGDFAAALSMLNRFGALFLGVALSMSIAAVRMTRSLSQVHTPRAITLGMLISMSFVPMLKGEIGRVREAMKTRGAGSILNPKILYRAFLVPFVMRLVNISDTLALSVETRGFTLGGSLYSICKKDYDGKTKILENTDFTAEYGEVTLLSGHSGEGKSTLMYIVSGIIPNVNYGELSGEVRIAGEDIKGKKLGYICRKVGVVLQNADEQIIQKIVEDEIAFGCENLAFPPEKIQKQIEIVCRLMKLDTKWKCRTLSGGQKQRLITASTLAMGQKIIILDEPLANLDKDGAAMLMGTLRSLARTASTWCFRSSIPCGISATGR